MTKKLPISIQTHGWYFKLFNGDAEADSAFRFIRDCGFEGIDYNFDKHLPTSAIYKNQLGSFFDMSVEELLEYFDPVKAASQKHGVAVVQGHAPYPMHVEGQDQNDGYMIMVLKKLLRVCRHLDCPALVVHSVKQWSWEENLNMYRSLIPEAKETGVKICLENMFLAKEGTYSTFCDPMEACRYLDMLNAEAGCEAFGFCYDIGHANLTGRSLQKDINALGHRLTILHIHDNNGTKDQHLMPYTQKDPQTKDNCTDWESFIAGLCDIGYRGAISFETHPALRNTPNELLPQFLKLIAEIGEYFRMRITRDSIEETGK